MKQDNHFSLGLVELRSSILCGTRLSGKPERETAQIVRGEAWQRNVGEAMLRADGIL